MMQISWRSEYGLLFLSALAENRGEAYLSLTAIAQKEKLPYRFVSQIATDLKKGGIVGSKEGSKGGYYLLKTPGKISIGDVVKVLDKSGGIVDCLGPNGCVKRRGCEVRHLWKSIQMEFNGILEKYTLADLMK